jgi:Rrf2 family protein
VTAEFLVASHALVFLAHQGRSCSSEEIAKNVCTNPARVRKVLSKLEKAGLVEAKNGYLGGFSLNKAPAEITLLDALDALDETLVAPRWRSGDVDMDCRIASGMADVMDGVLADVNRSGRATLQAVTVAELERRLANRK